MKKSQHVLITELVQTHIKKILATVSFLEKAILAFSDNKILETEEFLEQLFKTEIEVDKLRREIFTELTKKSLPVNHREDLKALVERLDRFADCIKDAARDIKIFISAKKVALGQVINISVKTVKQLVESVKLLDKSIGEVWGNPSQAINFAIKVYEAEENADSSHLKGKMTLIENLSNDDFPTLLVLKDFIDSLERAADMCADTADFLIVLAGG